jgi:hypothetical protein
MNEVEVFVILGALVALRFLVPVALVLVAWWLGARGARGV